MNTTATHDTKRGEDVRARINVLSELPDEWDECLRTWSRINRAKRPKSKARKRLTATMSIFFIRR